MTVRRFDTGATRDSDDGKLDYYGFLDPEVLLDFARYMNGHRYQSDGSLRASDNWKNGIPQDVYIRSLLRHVFDLWLWHNGTPADRPETGETPSLHDTLGGVLFNVMGYWRGELQQQEAS